MQEHHHTQPEESSTPREALLSRRNVLQLGLLGAYAATFSKVAIDTWDSAATMARDHNVVAIHSLPDDEADEAHPHTATLYLPGLKNTWNESRENLKALQPTLRGIGRMASVGYSNLRFDQDEIVDNIKQYLRTNKIEKVHLYGGSFSGMVATAITPQLMEAGYEVPAIFCDSSPSGPEDVRDQFTFQCMALAAKLNLSVPDLARYMTELAERAKNKNERSLLQILDQSWEQITPQACSTTLAVSQIGYISRFNLKDYADKLGETPMVYLGNVNDVVINYETASTTWRETLPRNMRLTSYDTDEAYHASPYYGKTEYNTQLSLAIENLELIPKPRTANTRYSIIE